MPKTTLTPQLLADFAATSPEGFYHQSEVSRYTTDPEMLTTIVEAAVTAGLVGHEGEYFFDNSRLTAEQVRERSALFRGTLAPLRSDGTPSSRPITERLKGREERLRQLKDPVFTRLIHAFDTTAGYLTRAELCTQSGDEGALATVLDLGLLKASDDLVFDPLRITRGSIKAMRQKQIIAPVRQQLTALLESMPGQTAPRVDLVERFGANTLQMVMESGGFSFFNVPTARGDSGWVRLKSSDAEAARQIALAAVQPKDEDWEALMPQAGNILRQGAHSGQDVREKVLARSYTIAQVATRIGVRKDSIQSAIEDNLLTTFIDPDGVPRIPAGQIEALLADPDRTDALKGLEVITVRELAIALNESPRSVEQKMRKAHIGSYRKVRWRQIAGLWNLPDDLSDFRALYTAQKNSWLQTRDEEKANERLKRDEQRRIERARREEERRQRELIRERLLAAFPTWQHAGRIDQQIILHVGPPNSGKTHAALEALSIANDGWYLAPLRLLAFEIFDRLNQRGIRCNLLTGEEYIPVTGARITAATIEMFDPTHSGDCVVLDEAQMLADPDRGWAWTRALMEAQAPDIHVIGPASARSLIEGLAAAAAIPVQMVEHTRLAPLEIASEPWPLERLPDRTILVAFSRRIVLSLKTELEMLKRKVSVVYGNLPPEVRRRQADRFADAQTEICVATDAVGMGLNLPADYVCFFETEKFDGKMMRSLTPSEVHQIGGRAGRYGLSTVGQIGATTRRNLKTLQRLYSIAPAELTHARVAPEVDDLALIPGTLAHRFAQWSELQSIPESLRGVIKPADIDERIALARMLTEREVDQLGLEAAVKLVNAPTRESSRDYWRTCSLAILAGKPMAYPPEAPYTIENNHQLDETERSIACADIYLWLSRRVEFGAYAPDEARVREMRTEWSMSIDAALLRRLDTLARCVNCRKPLPLGHRYSLCDECYNQRTSYWY
ncbi:MAG: helicase-related protein [Chloroflexota bacterium]